MHHIRSDLQIAQVFSGTLGALRCDLKCIKAGEDLEQSRLHSNFVFDIGYYVPFSNEGDSKRLGRI